MMKRPTLTIQWNDEMNVGIPEIDVEHKPIILLINELNRAITEGMNPAEIKRWLQHIVDDTEMHFSQEEKLFQEWQYPDAAEHARIHSQLFKALQEIKAECIPYGVDTGWVEVGMRIKRILLNHFQNEDVKYAEYSRKSSHV